MNERNESIPHTPIGFLLYFFSSKPSSQASLSPPRLLSSLSPLMGSTGDPQVIYGRDWEWGKWPGVCDVMWGKPRWLDGYTGKPTFYRSVVGGHQLLVQVSQKIDASCSHVLFGVWLKGGPHCFHPRYDWHERKGQDRSGVRYFSYPYDLMQHTKSSITITWTLKLSMLLPGWRRRSLIQPTCGQKQNWRGIKNVSCHLACWKSVAISKKLWSTINK